MKMKYIKHLIECQCTLSIFKEKTKPVYHKFPVFSLLDDDNIISKYVICDNCDVIHYVNEVAKSEIKWGKENLKSLITTKEDISFNLKSKNLGHVAEILSINNCCVSDWEQCLYFVENNIEDNLVFNKEEIDNNIVVSYLEFKNNNIIIKKEILQRYL